MPRRLLCLLLLASTARIFAQSGTPYSIDGTAGGPTDEETFHLELINRARIDPAGEATRLRTTTDADVLSAVAFFETDLNVMAQEIAALPPVPPVAFNARLINAARAKKGKPMADKLAEQILLAAKNEGEAIKKKDDMHRMADANKAFAHFAW